MNPKLLAPGPDGQPITRKGSVVDREQFELMKDEYYRLRGWDVVTGLQVEKVVEAMGKGEPVNSSDKVSVFRDDGLRPCGSASEFVCAKAFTLLLLLISSSH